MKVVWRAEYHCRDCGEKMTLRDLQAAPSEKTPFCISCRRKRADRCAVRYQDWVNDGRCGKCGHPRESGGVSTNTACGGCAQKNADNRQRYPKRR